MDMKMFKAYIYVLVLLFTGFAVASAQSFDYTLLKGHPRLLMSDDDFSDLRRKVNVDRLDNVVLADVNDLIIGYADEYLAAPEVIEFKLDASGKRMILSDVSSDPSIEIEYALWEAKRPDFWKESSLDRENKGYVVAGYKLTVPAGRSVVLTTKLIPDNR